MEIMHEESNEAAAAEDTTAAPDTASEAPASKAPKKKRRRRKKGMTPSRPIANYDPDEDPDLWEDLDAEEDPWVRGERFNPYPALGRPNLVIVKVHRETGEVKWPANVERWKAQRDAEEEKDNG